MKLYSVSEILTYQKCPTKWAFSYHLGRTKRYQSAPALHLGSAGHLVMENLFNGLLYKFGPLIILRPLDSVKVVILAALKMKGCLERDDGTNNKTICTVGRVR